MSKLSLNQKFGYVFGGIYLTIGIVGFFITGFSDFTILHSGKDLIVFEVNPLHNVVHIMIGITLIIAARNAIISRMTNTVIGTIYLVVGVVGLFIASTTNSLNVLSLNHPDNGLHIATAILAFGVVFSEKPVMVKNQG